LKNQNKTSFRSVSRLMVWSTEKCQGWINQKADQASRGKMGLTKIKKVEKGEKGGKVNFGGPKIFSPKFW